MPTSLPSDGTPSALDLCRPCACYHSLCEFICVSFLLRLESLFPLGSSIITTGSYNISSFSTELLSPEGRDFYGDIPLRTGCQICESVLFLSTIGGCFSYGD